jgi:predicted metal-binding membrane protein
VGGVASSGTFWRLTPQAAVLLLIAAIAWVAIGAWSTQAGAMSGTMGLQLPAFLVGWTVMMAAMMLPSVAPVASLYARSISGRRALRLTHSPPGYLVVWASAGVVAFALGSLIAGLAEGDGRLGTAAGVVAYLGCGIYQLSPLKYRCLAHCRSPLSLFFKYSSYQGALRDLRVGVHHGAYCLGCCWGLMVVLLALGAMSVVPMLILASVVLAEKLWSRGEDFSRVVGVACLALAIATIWIPGLAPGFAPAMPATPSM